MLDEIRIRELEVFARHGVAPEENKLGQKFLVNAVIYTRLSDAAADDDITKSVHYGKVCEFITQYMQQHTFKLIETAAVHLADELLLGNERMEKIDLEIVKPWAPIGLPVESVSVKITRGWHRAFLSLGSNMGDRKAYLEEAVKKLSGHPLVSVEKVSDWIDTRPYGGVPQEDFLNGAAEIRTILEPEELLDLCHQIENEAGRRRKVRWGPRTLDLDILFYDSMILDTETLAIPHTDLQNRDFVLDPMEQIAPDFRHPVYGRTIRQLKKELDERGKKTE